MTRMTALRGRFALTAVKRTLPSRMSADPIAGLPDGLHAAIAGSGSPLPDPRRGNPCVAVIAGTAHAWPVSSGTNALPPRPKTRKRRSTRKAPRAR